MHLIDTHAHAQFPAYQDGEAVVKRAVEAGVEVINVGTQLDTSRWAVELAEKFSEKVYAVIGLHPTHTYDNNFEDAAETYERRIEKEFDVDAYRSLAQRPSVVGIGECGLDYYRLPENLPIDEIKNQQESVFRAQIDLAVELDKTLVIHCRPSKDSNDAYLDAYAILKEFKAKHPDLRFEIHSFTGDVTTANEFTQIGGFIGLNGIITFDKTNRSREVVNGVSLDSIVLETDCPYLAPMPYRGKQNEPLFVEYIAQKIAEWRELPLERVAAHVTANAQKLFKLPV